MAGAPGTIGSQVPPGPDEVWRQIAALQQQAQQALAFAANAQATSSQLAANVAALAASGTTWMGPVASPSTVTAAGTITAATVTASGNVTGGNVTGGNVFAQSLATVITAGRVALWGRTSDGYIATASSSERFKTNIKPVDPAKAAAILRISVSYFQYIDEVRTRDDPTFPGYIGPGYHVGTNLGAIAEQLHKLGLWEWVVYEREPVYEDRESVDEDGEPVTASVIVGEALKLDGTGNPIPSGIHDILIGWAALIVVQEQQTTINALLARVTALEA